MVENIGLIAGNGQFPLLFARTARRKGWQVHAVAYREETDPRLAEHVDSLEWLYLGQLKRMLKFFHQRDVSQAVMLGGITKTRFLSKFRPDMKTIALLAGMRHTHDDAVLRALPTCWKRKVSHPVVHLSCCPNCWPPPACGPPANRRHRDEDIRMGWKMAKAIGSLDIGQCVLVAGGTAVAVEAMEGTDAAILGVARWAKVRRWWSKCASRFRIPASMFLRWVWKPLKPCKGRCQGIGH
jgi:UDP-2,3-diacylglucosamine hydrolase